MNDSKKRTTIQKSSQTKEQMPQGITDPTHPSIITPVDIERQLSIKYYHNTPFSHRRRHNGRSGRSR